MRAWWLKTGTICMAGSPGGHLDLLRSLKPAVADHRCSWITAAGSRAATLREQEQTVYPLAHWGRNAPRLMRNIAQAIAVIARERPGVVITSGAGVVVPFCLLARLAGANLVFTETMARVDDGSLSGRLLSRFASAVVVQWPETSRVYPQATLCRPALLEDMNLGSPAPGQGTFVAVGTHGQPFDRLLESVDRAVGAGLLPKPILAQTGVSTYRPVHYTATPWLKPDQIRAGAASAEFVVCHAGSGIISAALAAGRKPLVMARLRAYDEHTDDHQRQLAAKLGELGVAVVVDGEISEAEVQSARVPLARAVAQDELPSVSEVLRLQLERIASSGTGMNRPRTPAVHAGAPS